MSAAKAVGLMQVTPGAGRDTAKRFGVSYDWDRLAAQRDQRDRFERIFPGVDGLISASTAAMTCSLVGVVTWSLPRNRTRAGGAARRSSEYSRRAVASSQCYASANFAHRDDEAS